MFDTLVACLILFAGCYIWHQGNLIKSLMLALWFYGDRDAYVTFKRKDKGRIHAVKSRILTDKGKRAREALGEE